MALRLLIAGNFYTTGSGSGGTPGGLAGQVQYNNTGVFGGVTGLTTSAGVLQTGIFAGAGLVSAPAMSLTGAWFSGGSSTTTKPLLLIEPAGTTSTGWPTTGTALGINAASGSTAHLIDAQLNGIRVFDINISTANDIYLDIYNPPGTSVISMGRFNSGNGPGIACANTMAIGFCSGAPNANALDAFFMRFGAAQLQMGMLHATTPTAQMLKAHDVTTGTGASLTLAGGRGSVAGGDIILATSATNGVPTAKLTINATGTASFSGKVVSGLNYEANGGTAVGVDAGPFTTITQIQVVGGIVTLLEGS